VRVFISSTLVELEQERQAAREAVSSLRLHPVMFESGARPHPPRDLYSAYIAQSQVFVGLYWKSYGWVAPGMAVSGLEDEYDLSRGKPRLVYIKDAQAQRDPGLESLLDRIRDDDTCSYSYFTSAEELGERLANDLVVLLSERFEVAQAEGEAARSAEADAVGGDSTTTVATPGPGQLPLPPTPLIGRDTEVASAASLLLSDDVRLLTLVGPGGTGKTRLAIDIAAGLKEQFAGGVYFVGLESVGDASLVLPTIAHTLGLGDVPDGRSSRDLLVDRLSGSEILLLLDNLEHLTDAAPDLASLLAAGPQLKLLTTSRAPLRLRAERLFPVPPLGVPPTGSELDLSRLQEYPAVSLLVARVRAVLPDFDLTEAQATAVAELCRRLEGLPLAIELAAARSKIFSPAALLARLEHSFDILRGSTRDLPPRQKTMAAAIDWSYSLLKEDEKRLLRALSIFAGGWTLESAQAVAGAGLSEECDLLSGLESLVDNSLVVSDTAADEGARFRMLETIREFARGRLEAGSETEALRRAHASYFLALGCRVARELEGSGQSSTYRQMKIELDNFRAALEWALAGGSPEAGLRVASELWLFWDGHGYSREGLHWLDRGLAAGDDVPKDLRAMALARKAWLMRPTGGYPQVVELYNESLALFQELGDEAGIGLTLSHLGVAAMRQGEYDRAGELFEQALVVRRRVGERRGIYATLMNLGVCELDQGHFERAAELLAESLELTREAQDDHHTALILLNLGETMMGSGDLGRAEAYFSEAMSIFKRDGNRASAARLSHSLAFVLWKSHKTNEALRILSEALPLLVDLQDAEEGTSSVEIAGAILADMGNPSAAARLLSAGQSLRDQIGVCRYAVYQSVYEATLAAVRSALSEEELAEASAEGARFSLDQALAYAQEAAVVSAPSP
jgi:predicted ATPase